MRKEINWGIVLMYVSAFIILIWALLKSFGVINTPAWIEMVPYYGVFVGVVAGAVVFGKLFEKVNSLDRKTTSYSRMKDDFISVRDKQGMCLSGELKGSPYSE